MPGLNPTKLEKEKLQNLYKACRGLLEAGIGTQVSVQKSFEEMLYGFLGEDSWRPTHITWDAIKEGCKGSSKNLQRAHGILADRLDRYERTMIILRGDEKPFNEWWKFYVQNDATVLITRKEHASGKKFESKDLIEIPIIRRLFGSSGFSFKFRKKAEVAWLKDLVCSKDRES